MRVRTHVGALMVVKGYTEMLGMLWFYSVANDGGIR